MKGQQPERKSNIWNERLTSGLKRFVFFINTLTTFLYSQNRKIHPEFQLSG